MNTVIISKNKELATEITKQIKIKSLDNNVSTLLNINDITCHYNYIPDMFFIDLEGKNTNLQKLCSDITIGNNNAKIVLICSDDYYAVKAFELGIFYYIVKPVEEKNILKVFDKWKMLYDSNNSCNT